MVNNLTILEKRVDWVSCSAKSEPKATALKLVATARLAQEWEAGDRSSYFGRNGYTGSQCGHWKYADGPEGSIVQVGGSEAHQWCRTLASYAEHFSRVDYCVTVQYEDPTYRPDYAIYEYFEERQKAGDPVVNVKNIRETRGGAGVQIGQRTSAYTLRVYNKHAESDGLYPEGSWRYEVEMKRHASEMEQEFLLSDQRRPDAALEVVSAILERWTIDQPWNHTTPVDLAKAPKRARDVEKALQWLRTQVAPSVEWLVSNGREEAVLEALNLRSTVN